MTRRTRREKRILDEAAPEARPAEQLLIEAIPRLGGDRVACRSQGRGQFAAALAAANGDARITCHVLDVQLAARVREGTRDSAGVEVVCTADFPGDGFDLCALPFGRNDEPELMRDTLQAGYGALVDGGRLLVAIDDPKDTWLHDELRKMFDKVTREPVPKVGVRYSAIKRGPLKRPRDFSCEFAFRDGERLVKAFSRPGVFGHRRAGAGARALLETVSVEPGDRILDLGCGVGTVGLALALRAAEVHVLAVDSNPRALACVERGTELNGLSIGPPKAGAATVSTLLDATATGPEARAFDLVVGSPPYSSNLEIPEVFVAGAARAVKPGGLVAFVTRQPDWFAERMVESFDDVGLAEVRSHAVVVATGR